MAAAMAAMAFVALSPGTSGETVEAAENRINVLIEVEIGNLVDGKRVVKKAYSLVVVDGGVPSKLLAGSRVPFPGGGEEDGLVYQNVGFVTEMRVWVMESKRVRLVADIEDSRVVPAEDASTPPVVETRQVSVSAILSDKEPLQVTQIDLVEADAEVGYINVTAEILP